MAVPALAFSGFFREKLVSGRMKGTVLVGKWEIPEGDVMVFCSGNGNVGESGDAEKLFTVKIKSCKTMEVSGLSDPEAKTAGYADGAELRASVKKWHGCRDADTVTFVEWE